MRRWRLLALVSHSRLRRLRLAEGTAMGLTGISPHTAMVGAAPTACIVLIELTRTTPGIAIIGPLMLTLATGHLLGLLRTGVGVRGGCATAILLTKD
jgi:hypothetical protein